MTTKKKPAGANGGRRVAPCGASGRPNDTTPRPASQAIPPTDPRLKEFTAHLWRGGDYGHFHSLPAHRSDWVKVGGTLPTTRQEQNVYMGVNPVAEIPRTNAKGEQKPPQAVRSQNSCVSAINCVYGDFDGKHYDKSDPTGRGKVLALAAIEKLEQQPTVIVDSGGGYHGYWLLDKTFSLNGPESRERATALLAGWVEHIGADSSVHDLARILRVPGTRNLKPQYAPDFPSVEFLEYSPDLTYTLAELEEQLPPMPVVEKTQSTTTPDGDGGDIVQRQRHWTRALETAAQMIQSAADGEKHSTLLKAARLLGGYLAGGMGNAQDASRLLESEIEKRPNVESMDAARDTIRDGLAYGKNAAIGFEQLEQERRDWLAQHANGAKEPTVKPEKLMQAVKATDGLAQAKAVEQLAAVVAEKGAAVADHYADMLAAAGTCTKTAFLQSVKQSRQQNREQAKRKKQTAGRKAAQARKLTSRIYHQLFGQWGYDVRLNLCNDDAEVDGKILTDQVLADIRQKVRDFAIDQDLQSSVGATEDSLMTFAQKHAYHPLKDYFDSLVWDGQDHIGALLKHFTGDGYLDRWLEHWLPGAVARVYEGWQNPMLVLDGGQGIGKSYFAKWLCSPLPQMFVESPINPDYKDHKLRLIQSFVWEVQELGATTRRQDQDALKAFITLTTIRERKAYGKRDVQKPVVCSFIGTINSDAGFLTDLTGNRRYLVTTLDAIDWQYSAAVDVDQLWAQAVNIYRSGDGWKLTRNERATSEEHNKEFMVSDPIQVFLESAYEFTADGKDFVSTESILDHLLTMHSTRATKAVTMKVASVLKSWGAVSDRPTITDKQGNTKQVRGYSGVATR